MEYEISYTNSPTSSWYLPECFIVQYNCNAELMRSSLHETVNGKYHQSMEGFISLKILINSDSNLTQTQMLTLKLSPNRTQTLI